MEQSDIKPKTENFQFSTSLVTLDFIGAVLGIIYILLEYRASIWLWIVSIIMPLVDMMLYFRAGLYADFGMAVYYALAAIYGFWMWKRKSNNGDSTTISSQQDSHQNRIVFFPRRLILPTTLCFLVIWMAIYQLLIHFTDSSVPITDSFTSALSIVALWALAHKYAEQWLLWIVVDAISSTLYVYKGIPFKASLYGLYVVIAIFGYRRWRQMAKENDNENVNDKR
ncbi:MAG: nicotinamide mononucleotide transporter [Bacteroidales bacterium]|nr:nicotinamide mononucleotide transporter [Bacteroidales bacterium]